MNYFVTAIGTDSGKTLVSAVLATALNADYWKPVQAGAPTDTDTVRSLVSNETELFPERHCLKHPMSPHAAAELESIEIKLTDFSLPNTSKDLVIEGAGGAMVPLNDHDFVIDLVPQFESSIILVSNLYLGSINHTLLTLELIQNRGYNLAGIIFNGPANSASEDIIMKHCPAPCLLKIPQLSEVNPEVVKQLASKIDLNELDRERQE